jgi:hypothetical protein
MNIFKQDTVLKITAANSTADQQLTLIYNLYDIDIVDRWIKLVDENNRRNNKLRYNYRKILNEEEIRARFKLFQDNIAYINANYDRVLTDIVSVHYLRDNQHILNDLHEEFEIYGDRMAVLLAKGYFNDPMTFDEYNEPWPGLRHNKTTHEAFLLLNEQIHNFEAVYRTWDDPTRSLCTCLVDFIPAGLHSPLRAEDYFLFTPDHEWGCAYLGYNTLGKHWSSTMHDNDIDVVKRGAVRPQQRFAAELYMNFSTPLLAQTRIEFYKWWTENGISKHYDPAMKLGDWAMGYIPVARLSKYQIDTGATINIPLGWSRKEKLEWNNQVWSQFSTIADIEIII